MSTGELRHHTFDGIQEYDNRLPNWWLWTFYLACIFSLLYWVHYHTLGTGSLPGEAYVVEQQEAAARIEAEMAKNPVTNEMLLKLAGEPAVVAEGEKIFKDPARCAQCHRPDGGGNIGPNLTDRFWINGGTPMDIYRTVSEGGRPDKGMQSWKANGQLFVQRAVAYVLSIRNTNVPDGKKPEPEAVEVQPQ
jgi:cytochrome c oxidase cbb3-type subunit 3